MTELVENLGYLPRDLRHPDRAPEYPEGNPLHPAEWACGLEAPRWIALLGIAAGSRNQGVQALANSLVGLCLGHRHGVKLRLLCGHSRPMSLRYHVGIQDYDVPLVNYRLAPTIRLREHLLWIIAMAILYRVLPLRGWRRAIARSTPWIDALSRSDVIADIRGGDSFSDIYGWKRFMTGFLAAWSAILVKGSLVQLPQTYGPFESPMARWLAKFLLRRSSLILARDRDSQRVAQHLVGTEKTVRLCPDVAFSLIPTMPARIVASPPLDGPVSPGIIGININGLMYHGGYNCANMFGLKLDYPGFARKLLEKLLDKQDNDIWLVPHTYGGKDDVESDPEAAFFLWSGLAPQLQARVRIIAPKYETHEIKGVIGRCDFFVGSRMHACVAALSQGIPCVGVAYSRKFKGVFETVGMEEWVIDGREASEDEAVARVMDLYTQRDQIRERLRRSAAEAKGQLVQIINDVGNQLGFTKNGSPVHEAGHGPEEN